MKRIVHALLALCLAICAVGTFHAHAKEKPSGVGTIAYQDLPKEAKETIALIKAGGPFPYKRDGIVFQNRERILPPAKRGFYKEYTVKTPGERTRGARRIVTGDNDTIFYYTDDHYASFKRVLEK